MIQNTFHVLVFMNESNLKLFCQSLVCQGIFLVCGIFRTYVHDHWRLATMTFDIMTTVMMSCVVEMIYWVTYGTCDYGVDIQGIARHSPDPPSIASIQASMLLLVMRMKMAMKTLM